MHTFQELKTRMKALMDKDGRFSEGYRKIVMDKIQKVIDECMGNGKEKKE